MSQTSVSVASRRALRILVACLVVVGLLAPAAYLFSRVRDDASRTLDVSRAERRGIEYLGPLTDLLGVVTRTQSAAVRGAPLDAARIRAAVAAVDEVDSRLGASLQSTERWTAIRRTIADRIARSWPDPAFAYEQFGDLVTSIVALTRKVADVSALILDPRLDAHYVTNAAVLRIPEVLVDSGRYLDLAVITTGKPDSDSTARLTAARDRIGADATDLNDGLITAFGSTGSTTLAPALTGPLDSFRAAVVAVAPSTSLLAQPPRRTPTALLTDQQTLQRTTLALQRAALTELDRLVAPREDDASRTRTLALVAFVLVAVVVAAAAVAIVLLPGGAPAGSAGDDEDEDETPPDGAARQDLVGAGSRRSARAAV
jgi:hypothetical protein